MQGPRSRISRAAAQILMHPPSYETWSREDLIARLTLLDSRPVLAQSQVPKPAKLRNSKGSKPFVFNAYPRRKIALKFCYSGWEYNGLVFQNDPTPLLTVEGVLYDALAATRLIDPEAGPEGCGWDRCGRTDRGVSAAGQVVSLWVRSNIDGLDAEAPAQSQISSKTPPDEVHPLVISIATEDSSKKDITSDVELPLFGDLDFDPPSPAPEPGTNLPKRELNFIALLNNVLPASIRIIAWSPVAPAFSARFACRHRHYKYFFSPHGLDIAAMRDAASRLVGEHDFRNLHKLDPSKQLMTFRRMVLRAEISPTSVSDPNLSSASNAEMYVFDLVGTAFLYHQVRHIMAVLLLVGARLESPSVMTALLNTDRSNPYPPAHEGEPVPEIVDTKPTYGMADGLPLMLWDCAYNHGDVHWRTNKESGPSDTAVGEEKDSQSESDESDAETPGDRKLYHEVHSIHSRSLIHSALDAHFLRAVTAFHPAPPSPLPLPSSSTALQTRSQSTPEKRNSALQSLDPRTVLRVPVGGGVFRQVAARSYIPLLRRKRLEPVEVVNERWRLSKGKRRDGRKAEEEINDVE